MQLHQRKRSEASLSDEWYLSELDFTKLCNEHNLSCHIDVCASLENTKCEYFIDKEMNALEMEWVIGKSKKEPNKGRILIGNGDTYINPPNSLTQKFIAKTDEQWFKYNMNIMMLIPINATVTKNGKKYIWDNPNVEIYPVLPTPRFIHNGVQGESARNRYCVSIWRKRLN